MRMPFGKYRDLQVQDLPRPYLRWLRGQKWVGGWLHKEIDAVLTGRQEPEQTFEEALEELKKEWGDG